MALAAQTERLHLYRRPRLPAFHLLLTAVTLALRFNQRGGRALGGHVIHGRKRSLLNGPGREREAVTTEEASSCREENEMSQLQFERIEHRCGHLILIA